MSIASIPVPAFAPQRSDPSQPLSLLHRLFSASTLFWCVLAAIVYICVPQTFADPDIGWHLRDAQILASTHHMIAHDLFSFTAADAPWMNHEWLAELPFNAAWRFGGTV
jgi:hypothetical protein